MSFKEKDQAFKNKSYLGKRSGECTTVAYCVGEKAPDEHWTGCTFAELEASNATPLYSQNEIRFFGWL